MTVRAFVLAVTVPLAAVVVLDRSPEVMRDAITFLRALGFSF